MSIEATSAMRVYWCPVCRRKTDQDKVLIFEHEHWCCRTCESMVFGLVLS